MTNCDLILFIFFGILHAINGHEETLMTFQEKDKSGDDLVNYYIKYIPESKYEEAIDLMETFYARDEPIFAWMSMGHSTFLVNL